MDHRVLTIRRWLLLALALVVCAFEPGLWFCVFAAPIMFFKTVGGKTGILISDDGKIIFGDPGQDCEDCCGFGACAQCTAQHEGSVQVVFTGIANGACGNCAALNGTFELPKIQACAWRLTGQSVVLTEIFGCHPSLTGGTGANTVNLSLTDPAAVDCSYQRLENGQDGARFQESYITFSQNCAGWEDEGINPSLSDTGCDESSATCEVTTL